MPGRDALPGAWRGPASVGGERALSWEPGDQDSDSAPPPTPSWVSRAHYLSSSLRPSSSPTKWEEFPCQPQGTQEEYLSSLIHKVG